MEHIFYVDFDNLLREYAEPVTREDKLIKHKLDSIVALYDNCSVEEKQFADEITLEFSRIIALLKNQHRQELMELSQQYQEFGNRSENLSTSYIPLHRQAGEDVYEYDYEVLNDFYDHFKREGDDQLSYWQIEGYEFESEEDRRAKVNLTMLDYCNRIKTFAKKYLYEIYPEDSIPRIIHGEDADGYETYEPIVFTYNNLELILAKMKTTNENGETVKQRLNIRSALRKLNEFKQETEAAVNAKAAEIQRPENSTMAAKYDSSVSLTLAVKLDWTDFEAYAPAGYRYYIEKIMNELGIKDLSELEQRIYETIDYCSNEIGMAKKSSDAKKAKKYRDCRAALRKYKNYMESKKQKA